MATLYCLSFGTTATLQKKQLGYAQRQMGLFANKMIFGGLIFDLSIG